MINTGAFEADEPAAQMDLESHPPRRDRLVVGLGMTAVVILLGLAINLHDGTYTPDAILTLSFALLCCVIPMAWPSEGILRHIRGKGVIFWFIPATILIALIIAAALYAKAHGRHGSDLATIAIILSLCLGAMLLPPAVVFQRLFSKGIILLAVGGIVLDVFLLVRVPDVQKDWQFWVGLELAGSAVLFCILSWPGKIIAAVGFIWLDVHMRLPFLSGITEDWQLRLLFVLVGVVALFCFLPSAWIKHVAVVIILLGFGYVGWHGILQHAHDPHIDVYYFQQQAATALMHGKSPYSVRFPNVYPIERGLYGPGVVDAHNMLTYGFPYPPLSLLMDVPAIKWGGDCRYALFLSLVISAGLMAYARPGKLGLLAAGLLLLTPRALFVVYMSWTEPLLLLTFSLALFCACRWRRAMPYALGLFFATKQYSVLSLPLLFLLTEGRGVWRQLWMIALKAGLVVMAITAPFFAWDPHEFWRAIVQWQFVQPFRKDALSYLVWMDQKGIAKWTFNSVDGKPKMWVPFLAVAPAVGVSLVRWVRSPAGFATGVTLVNFVFFAFNKQAFCNYYFFVIGTACWAIAAIKPPVIHDPAVSSR